VHATVAHVYPIDNGIMKRSAALDDPPTHGSDIVIQKHSFNHGEGMLLGRSVTSKSDVQRAVASALL
jgi:hypothetical protein